MKDLWMRFGYVGLIAAISSCSGADEPATASPDAGAPEASSEPAHEDDHAHAEDPLGVVDIGGMQVELKQGHGAVAAGKEAHLVVKLPYSDQGATVVRAWIGSEDRTLSYVGKGEWEAAHDDFDIHATAPSPLPDGVMWWIEIEKPDGTKVVGAAEPLME